MQERPRDIGSIQPDEYDQYCVVLGWRIWKRNIHTNQKYFEAAEEAAKKPQTLRIPLDGKGYQFIWNKTEVGQPVKIPALFRGTGTFDRPHFLLEPLTDDEVAVIDQNGVGPGPLGSTDKPQELLRPVELRRIFAGGLR